MENPVGNERFSFYTGWSVKADGSNRKEWKVSHINWNAIAPFEREQWQTNLRYCWQSLPIHTLDIPEASPELWWLLLF